MTMTHPGQEYIDQIPLREAEKRVATVEAEARKKREEKEARAAKKEAEKAPYEEA